MKQPKTFKLDGAADPKRIVKAWVVIPAPKK